MLARTDLGGRTHPRPNSRRASRGGVDVDAVLHQVRPMVEAVRDRGAEAALESSARSSTAFVRPSGPGSSGRARSAHFVNSTRPSRKPSRLRSSAPARCTPISVARTPSPRWSRVARSPSCCSRRARRAVRPRWQRRVPVECCHERRAGSDGRRRTFVVASPPQAEFGGLPHPTILAAAAMLGVDEVWAVGGGQGVALLTYGGTDTDGTELVPVDLITGPGNIYVTAAKRLCRGLVGIDAEAGPTEIAILADHTADPVHVAADLISQAEHDVMAASVLVTTSVELADAVDAAPGRAARDHQAPRASPRR